MAGVNIKFFSNFFENAATKRGGNLDSNQCRDDAFLGIFPKPATQRGVVWDITPIEGECFFGLFSENSNTTGCRLGNNPDRELKFFLKKSSEEV